MDLKKLTDCIEKFSPSRLAVPGDYVGVQVGPRDSETQERTKIRKCAITPYAKPQSIIRAANDGANAIIAYYGLITYPVKAITDGLLDMIRLLIENKIVLYVVHTSWLSAECGINDTLADMLGLTVAEAFNVELKGRIVPLGRVCTFDKNRVQSTLSDSTNVSLSDFIAMMSRRLATDDIVYVGSSQSPIRKILLLTGEHSKVSLLRLAKSMDVDTFVTGSITREMAMLSSELRMNYVSINHDAVESIGMRRLMQLLSIDAPEVEFIFIEGGQLWKRYASVQFPARKEDKFGRTK